MNISKEKKLIGIGLISGGLDSLIATLILRLQDIEIIGINFKSPFCLCDKAYKNAECGLNLFYEKLEINVKTFQKGDDYLELIRNPKYGYGKHLNPCIDCRIYILNKAKEYAKNINADFIYTGEVLNQRPKSQNKWALNVIEKETGLEGKLLRPLSALLLKPTILEREGLVDRSKLLGIKGRSRKVQLEIAKKHGLLEEYYACGGCLLTDKNFSKRLTDFFEFNKNSKMEDIKILKYGRHFRFKNRKIIVGRNEFENNILLNLKKPDDLIMEAKDEMGPITIIQGSIDNDVLNFAAQLTLRYSDAKENKGTIIYGNDMYNLNKMISIEIENEEFLKQFII